MASPSPEQLLEKQKLAHQAWTEHIRKELASLRLGTEFIPNPYTLDLISDKPTRARPATAASAAHDDLAAADLGRLREIITRRSRTPKEKWTLPLTTAHEYGWDQDAYRPEKRWMRPRGSTSLTQYVQAYILSQGASPFAKKAEANTSAAASKH